ncbi:MAG: UDP-N-acetylmuramoyl-tripeptide--D-alanyl-D-alanine ligase, partial [Paracoccaceae bacterium]
ARVHAAEKSFNNHWGVPLTLARMPADADYAIVEIGMNHPGEIAPLARLARPDVAMITIVAPAHMQAFADIGGLAGIAREKAAIFAGVAPGGVAVINGDLEVTPLLRAAASAAGLCCLSFGETAENDFRLSELRLVGDKTIAQLHMPEGDVLFKLMSAGRHFAQNAAGTLAAVSALGGDTTLAARDLMLWQPPPGRGRRQRLALDPVETDLQIELIDDAYNANPTSVAAALEVLAAATPNHDIGRIAKGRRIAILGDMLELGPDEDALHAGLADLRAFEEIDLVHCVGPRMQHLWKALPASRRGRWHADAAAMAAQAHHLVDAGDVIMLKGSQGARIGLVVDAIRKLGHPVTQENEGS